MTRRLACTIACLGLLVAPQSAFADADPASDVLTLQDVYLPYKPAVSQPLANALTAFTKDTARAGYQLKIAVISGPNDLGAVPDFFGRPQKYADFLGQEIAFNAKRPLLVVMPAGVGLHDVAPAAAAAARKVDVPSDADGDELARVALRAGEKLVTAAGHPVKAPDVAGGGSKATSPLLVFGAPVVLVALAGLAIALVGRRRERSGDQRPEP